MHTRGCEARDLLRRSLCLRTHGVTVTGNEAVNRSPLLLLLRMLLGISSRTLFSCTPLTPLLPSPPNWFISMIHVNKRKFISSGTDCRLIPPPTLLLATPFDSISRLLSPLLFSRPVADSQPVNGYHEPLSHLLRPSSAPFAADASQSEKRKGKRRREKRDDRQIHLVAESHEIRSLDFISLSLALHTRSSCAPAAAN